MGSPIDVGGQYPFITFFTPPRLSGKFLLQDTSTPTRATNHFRTSSLTLPTSGINRTQWILSVIQGTFAAIK